MDLGAGLLRRVDVEDDLAGDELAGRQVRVRQLRLKAAGEGRLDPRAVQGN
jgi:hypothetical protein